MSDNDHGAHAAAAHGTGHDDHGHGHAAETLGPIDWPMWLVGVIGVAAAIVVVICFVMATQGTFGLLTH
jgi:hypothetical protein